MANYKIFREQEEINRIWASDEDFVAELCARNGYTYEREPDPEPAPPQEPAVTADDLLSALLGGTLADESGGGGRPSNH